MAQNNQQCVQFAPLEGYNWGGNPPGKLRWNPVVYCVVAAIEGISYSLAIELSFRVCFTFKRQNGPYFWSIVLTIVGICVYNTAGVIHNFVQHPEQTMMEILLNLGWGLLNTGFSLVLWSRLHLVVNNPRFLKVTLIIILANAVIWNALSLGISIGYVPKFKYEYPLAAKVITIMESVVYIVQETFLSAVYMYQTARFLKRGFSTHIRKIISFLQFVQMLVIASDLTLFVMSMKRLYIISAVLFPFTCAIKLHLEIAVLDLLRKLVQRGLPSGLTLLPVQETKKPVPIAPREEDSDQAAQTGFLTTPQDLSNSAYIFNRPVHLDESMSQALNKSPNVTQIGEEIDSSSPDEDIDMLEEKYLGRRRR